MKKTLRALFSCIILLAVLFIAAIAINIVRRTVKLTFDSSSILLWNWIAGTVIGILLAVISFTRKPKLRINPVYLITAAVVLILRLLCWRVFRVFMMTNEALLLLHIVFGYCLVRAFLCIDHTTEQN